MRKDVLTVTPGTSTMEALRLMAEKQVGSIVVRTNKKPLGIFTERDLLYKVVLAGKDPAKTPVKEVMTKHIVTVTPDRSLNTAYHKMTQGNFRHLLISDEKNRLQGIISIKDLVRIREQILEIEVEKKTKQILEVSDRLAESLALLEKEMMFAGKFQRQLIEMRRPTFKNMRIKQLYRQAASLGGDYFGVTRIDSDHAGILVVDVMGHGITSAMIAVEVKMYYDMLSKRILDPGMLITEMNKLIAKLMPPGFFVAGCYAVLNLKTLHMGYTHFGLPGPGVLRGSGKYEKLPPCQVPLGIGDDTQYPQKDIFIKPGDRLLFFTDGCIEQKNNRGKLLGNQRFIAHFKKLVKAGSRDIPKDLYRFILDYSGSSKLNDDLAILLVEFNKT